MVDFLTVTSPKRKQSESSWNECFPYYAGFPETFAREIIASAKVPTDGLILDPWNGSGTTTYAASRLGYRSKGIDLNPVMVLVARARALPPSEAYSIEPQARILVRNIDRIVGKDLDIDPLSVWFTNDTTRIIRALERRIRTALVDEKSTDSLKRFSRISCFAATFYVALFTVCRNFTREYRSSNPTWLRIPKDAEKKISLCSSEVTSAFISQAKLMAASLQTMFGMQDLGVSEIDIGNSMRLESSESADLILSSPPYCTRIDYTSATRIELAIIAPLLSVRIDQLSREMIGSVKVPLTKISADEAWGSTCTTFLDRLFSHESKASSGYYYKTHLDYFDKLFKSVVKIADALKPNGIAVLVVQDSHYKEVHNDVALILSEMANEAGLTLTRREDFRQSNPISGINSKAKLYRQTVGATESVLCFKNAKRI